MPQVSDYSVMDYFTQQHFFDVLYRTFYGYVGFTGYCLSAEDVETALKFCKGSKGIAVENQSIVLFTLVALVATLWLVWHVLKNTWKMRHKEFNSDQPQLFPSLQSIFRRFSTRLPGFWFYFALLGCVLMGAAYYHASKQIPQQSHLWQGIMATLAFCGIAGLGLVLGAENIRTRLLAYGPIIFLLFTFLLFVMGHKGYVLNGVMSGVQGRYLFPFLPLLLASFGLTLSSTRRTTIIIALLTIVLLWAHLNAYTGTILPFFNTSRL